MDRFKFESMLDEIKMQFFKSSYSTVAQFARFHSEWPSEFDASRVAHWNKLKKEFLENKLTLDSALGITSRQNLKDRLDIATTLITVLEKMAIQQNQTETPDIKMVKEILTALEKASAVQDKTTDILQIEAIKEDEFTKNKSSVLDELRRNSPKPAKSQKQRGVL